MRALVRQSPGEWSIEILPPAEQAQYDRLWQVLVDTLGLDWITNVGAPDGHEVADDCAAELWDAGFRIPATTPPTATSDPAGTSEQEASS